MHHWGFDTNCDLAFWWQDAKSKVKNSRCKEEERMVKLSETNKVPAIGIKSFSHELGPRGGVQASHPRPHSYNDLKVMLLYFDLFGFVLKLLSFGDENWLYSGTFGLTSLKI